MAEKPDAIMEKLESLRRKTHEEVIAPPIKPSEERKKLARIIGILVIAVFALGIFFAGYTFLKPAKEEVKEKKAPLEQIKTEKLNAINDAFAGLPPGYGAEKFQLIDSANRAGSAEEVESIDFSNPANNAWRSYTLDTLNEIAKKTESVEMEAGTAVYRGIGVIKDKISQMSYADLKTAAIRELRIEYVPVRLSRERAAGGMLAPGNVVNIYFKEEKEIKTLAKDARVTAVLRGKSSGSISLTESEKKSDTGGGVEGAGTATSLSIGGSGGSLAGSFEGSSGMKMRATETTYTVNIEEIQKAAAASKLPESYIKSVLENYGLKLNTIERETNIGDLDIEYLILFEVSSKEAPELVLRALTSDDRAKMFVTISETSAWMEGIK